VALAPRPLAPLLGLVDPPSPEHRGGDQRQDDDLGDGGAGAVHLGAVSEQGAVLDLDELLV
jgi:hypothetical protein